MSVCVEGGGVHPPTYTLPPLPMFLTNELNSKFQLCRVYSHVLLHMSKYMICVHMCEPEIACGSYRTNLVSFSSSVHRFLWDRLCLIGLQHTDYIGWREGQGPGTPGSTSLGLDNHTKFLIFPFLHEFWSFNPSPYVYTHVAFVDRDVSQSPPLFYLESR